MNTEQNPLNSGFGFDTTAMKVIAGIDLRGKTAIVTGGHNGVGLETTKALVSAGATILVGARDMDKAQRNLKDIGGAEVLPLDLSEPASIDAFAAEFLKTSRFFLAENFPPLDRSPHAFRIPTPPFSCICTLHYYADESLLKRPKIRPF